MDSSPETLFALVLGKDQRQGLRWGCAPSAVGLEGGVEEVHPRGDHLASLGRGPTRCEGERVTYLGTTGHLWLDRRGGWGGGPRGRSRPRPMRKTHGRGAEAASLSVALFTGARATGSRAPGVTMG